MAGEVLRRVPRPLVDRNTNICSHRVSGATIHPPGVPVQDDLILELPRIVDDDALASKLETAFGRMTRTASFPKVGADACR